MIAGTVVNRDWIAHARALAGSFHEHHPNDHFVALVIDDPVAADAPDESFETVSACDVGIERQELYTRATSYDARELACSLKPALLTHLLERGQGPAVFIDADSCLYGPLDDFAQAAERAGLALTPHQTRSGSSREEIAAEMVILYSGIFNTGLVGVGRRGTDFLRWWSRRMERHCLNQAGFYLDQGWLSLVPALFEHECVGDPGLNVAGWNLAQRPLTWADDRPMVAGAPLRHFHFAAGFDATRPDRLSHTPGIFTLPIWENGEGDPAVARLAGDYAGRLHAAGYEQASAGSGAFERVDGTEIDDAMRTAYRSALHFAELKGTARPPTAFDNPQRFWEWLRAPHPAAGDDPAVSRYLIALREVRGDLMSTFRWIPGASAPRLLDWARDAATRGEIPPSMAPPGPGRAGRAARAVRRVAAEVVPGRGAARV